MNINKIFTKIALAAAFVFFDTALYAQEYDQLSIDNDFEPNQAGYYYIDLPQNGTKEVFLTHDQTIKVYDHHGKNDPLVAKESSDGRLLIHAPDGYALQVTGKTDAMMRNPIQQEDANWLSAYEDAEQSVEITKMVRNSDNISFASSGNSMLILLHIKTPYIYSEQYGLELTVSQIKAVTHTISVATTENGIITSDKSTCATNETVTVTVNPASGYLLTGIDITDTDNGTVLSTVGTDQWYSGKQTVTFKMQNQDVTLTPVFTNDLTANTLPTLNMPLSGERTYLIPDGVKSFNISGSPLGIDVVDAYVSTSTSAILQVPDGYCLQATGNVDWDNSKDDQGELRIYDGNNTSVTRLRNIQGKNKDIVSIGTQTSSSNCMTIYLYECLYDAKFTGTVTVLKSIAHTDITISDISAQPYTGSTIEPEIEVKDGETTLVLGTDYTVVYSDNTNTGTATATIIGQGNYGGSVEKTFTIVPKVTTLGALKITEDQDGKTAEINGAYTKDETPVTLANDIEVNSITIDRTFQTGVTSTIILPFGVESGNYSGGTFYEFTSVDYEDGKWVASMTKVTGKIEAHKPYLFVPSSDKLTITGGVKLEATSAEEYEDVKGDWTFKGVFKVKKWKTSVRTDYFFASTSGTSTAGDAISAGDFVRVGNNCGLSPLRCYLSYSGNDATLSKAEKQLPSSIEVRLIDAVSSVVEPENPSENDNDGDIKTPVSEIIPNSGVKVWSYDRTIFIESQSGSDYTVVDLSGRTLKKGVTNSTREEVTLSSRTAGIVIVKVGKQTFKINY